MHPHERRRETPLERRYVRFLAEVGAIFGEPLPYEATLQRVCDAAVATIADTATMYLYDDNSELQVVGAAHVLSERSERLRLRVEAILRDAEGPRTWLESVVRGGRGILVEHVDDSSIDSVAVGAEHARYLRDAGVRSFIVVPIVGLQSELRGLLALVYTRDSGLHYDGEALILAEDIGRRCGAALEKAKAHETAVDVSTRFQLAALPRSLPRIPGFEVDSFYEPATSEMLIGGDWYDAFMLPDGRIGMTVGDISGHGVDAAAFMGSLRDALRIAMFMQPDLLQVLDAADVLLKQEAKSGMFATTNIAVVDTSARTLRCAAAGHPGPLCWDDRKQTVTDPFTERGLPLGFRELAASQECTETVTLERSSFVCFFTDGLLEGERDYLRGLERLERVIARRQIRESRYPAWSIRHAVAPKHHPDDLAVMILRVP